MDNYFVPKFFFFLTIKKELKAAPNIFFLIVSYVLKENNPKFSFFEKPI